MPFRLLGEPLLLNNLKKSTFSGVTVIRVTFISHHGTLWRKWPITAEGPWTSAYGRFFHFMIFFCKPSEENAEEWIFFKSRPGVIETMPLAKAAERPGAILAPSPRVGRPWDEMDPYQDLNPSFGAWLRFRKNPLPTIFNCRLFSQNGARHGYARDFLQAEGRMRTGWEFPSFL